MHSFTNNRLYQFLSGRIKDTEEFFFTLNKILHEEPELGSFFDPIEGSYFHLICRKFNENDERTHRIVYALSNAGGNPNLTDQHGNSPLHVVVMKHSIDVPFDLIQSLFRVGVDPRIVNEQGKTASDYLDDNPQLIEFFHAYRAGIWSSIEKKNFHEVERLIQGFTKVDCKSSTNKTLLEKATELNLSSIIHLLAESQVTIEFVHSILAFDWERMSLIHQYQNQFIRINASDPVHVLTWARTTHRTLPKSILEICFDTKQSVPFELIFQSSTLKSAMNVNSIGTDGLPLFFHAFDSFISENIRQTIFSLANFKTKSSKGEHFLFHLVDLFEKNPNDERYIEQFKAIVNEDPFLLSVRNQQGRTVFDVLHFKPAAAYESLKPFDAIIRRTIETHWHNADLSERFLLNNFAYHLLFVLNAEEQIQSDKRFQDLVRSLTTHQGLVASIDQLRNAIAEDNLLQVQSICKTKSNILLAKDWSGRTMAHLAVLYQSRQILNFICDQDKSMSNTVDNLCRTPLHYASILNDQPMIKLLQKFNGKQSADCFHLFPDDYIQHRELCSEEFHALGFPQKELEREIRGLSDMLVLIFYATLKQAIEQNDMDQLKSINDEINSMGFSLKNFQANSYANDYFQGERYIPLLFIAIEQRSASAFRCLTDFGLTPIGRNFSPKSKDQDQSRFISLRSRAEELECFDIIGILDDLEEDHELKNIFDGQSTYSETVSLQNQSSVAITRQTKPQQPSELKSNNSIKNDSQFCLIA